MNRDEQKQISEFIEQAVKGNPGTPLPPMDIEADAIIRALFVRNPEAAYRMTMLAMEQSRALAERQAEGPSPAARTMFGRLFGRRPRPEDRPEPQFPAFERSI